MPSNSAHVVAVITPHGYGHAAIVTAVLSEFGRRHPSVRLTLVSTVPEQILRNRLKRPFSYVRYSGPADFGMVMRSSVAVDAPTSFSRYASAHERWGETVAEMESCLAPLRPDLVLTSASYVAIAAAHRIGCRSIAVGPFSWIEIFRSYCGGYPGASRVLDQMKTAYETADAFLLTRPGVSMDLRNQIAVGPVGLLGQDHRSDLAARVGAVEGTRFAFLSMGGISDPSPVSDWPEIKGWNWLVPDGIVGGRRVHTVSAAGLSVSDAIASCDAVVTKPGYGIFVEAAGAGVPMLYLDRPDWPETVGLHAWYAETLPIFQIDPETFRATGGSLYLQELSNLHRKPLGVPKGNSESANIIERFIL